MRTETIKDRKIEVRPLTRKQLRELKKFGFGPALCVPSMDTLDDALEAVLPLSISKEDNIFLDECSPVDLNVILKAIIEETYGSPKAEKNLQSTGDGSTTESE